MAASSKPSPPAIDALLQAAHAAYLAGRRDNSESLLRQALELDPRNTAAWNNLASVLDEAGHAAEAEAAYRKGISLNPEFAELHANFGNLLKATDRPGEAEAEYRQAIKLRPGHAPTLAQLAQLLKEQGRAPEAEKLFRESVRLDPNFALAHNNLGILLKEGEKLVEAEAAYRRALKIDPRFAAAHNNLGILLLDDARYVDAEAAFRRAIELQPDFPDAHSNLGNVLKQAKRTAEAEVAYRRAIELNPAFAEAHNNLGLLLKDAEKPDEAEAAYRRSLALRPEFAEAHNNLGILLLEQERLAEAEDAFRRALALKPDFADVHGNLANLLKQKKLYPEAEAAYRRALELNPDEPGTHNNLAILLSSTRRFGEAEAAFRHAIELKPEFAEAHNNLGNLLKEMGRPDEAEAAYRDALDLKADFTDARLNLGLLLLALGRYADAWPWHEARHFPDSKARRAMQPPFAFPQWQGEPLAGKSLVVVLEQGAGDNIQFVRYAPLLKARGVTRLTFVQPSAFIPLQATADGIDFLVTDPATVERHDYWVFPLSLPFHLGTTLDTIPDTLPYLWALPERIERWRPRLPAGGFRVGLVWKGNPDHQNDANRSLSHLSLLAPLWTVPGVSFVSLQKGQGEDEARQPPPDQPLVHLGDDIADFADTAAIIAQLDLVITVDSAAAHVAGALGKPVWVLLPSFGTDWRWLLDREDSPWYPNVMRLFRQPRDALSWQDSVVRVARELQNWSAAPPALTLPVSDKTSSDMPVVDVSASDTRPAVSKSAVDILLHDAHTAYLAGRREEAAAILRKAIVLDPSNASAWNNLASTLAETGLAADAEAAYHNAIELAPDFVDVRLNLAKFLDKTGRSAAAEEAYRAAITLRPDDADTHNNLGIVLFDRGRHADAEALFREAARLAPTVPTYRSNLGNALRLQKRHDEAEAAYREALVLLPNDHLQLNNLAAVVGEAGRDEEALTITQRVTVLAPQYADGWNHYGGLLHKLGRFAEAEAACRKALAIDPQSAAVHDNLGEILDSLRRQPEAEVAYRRALELDPDRVEVRLKLGILLRDAARFAEAEVALRHVIGLMPDYDYAHWNLVLLLLSQGRWAEAWPGFFHRNGAAVLETYSRRFGCLEWQGQSLAGKSLLIDSIEGHGDNITFVRYAALLKQAGASRVVLLHRASLKPLLETAAGVDAVIQEVPRTGTFDYWTLSFDLPSRFATTPETIPNQIPYLQALPERIDLWRPRLPVSGFKVGLAWKGNPDHQNDANRSLPHLSTLAPLWNVPGVSFVSLQKGQGEDEARQPPPGQPLVHLGDDIADFADTAAIVAHLDLLITVDSAAAHVAGALGKPVWVLLPSFGTDWRWLLDREDSPWYPGVMRLFRQARGTFSWDATVERVVDALQQQVEAGRTDAPPTVFKGTARPVAGIPGSPPSATLPADSFAQALAAYQSGRFDEAKSILREMLARNPGDAGCWNNLGNLHQDTGSLGEAEEAFRKAIELLPGQADFHSNLGNTLKLARRLQEAEAAYRRAIEIQPDNAPAHSLLGNLLKEDQRPDEAAGEYLRALELKPDYADAENNLGILYKDTGRVEEAESAYRRALELNPAFAEAHNNLGILLLEDERFPEAEVELRRALELKPDFADVFSNLGNLLKQTRHYPEAEQAYRRAIDLKPGDATAHNNLGVLLHEAGDLDAAETAYRHSLALNPDFADAHSNLGILLQRLGQFPEAEVEYRRSIELKPDGTDAKLNLGLLLLALGRYADAWPWHEARHFPDSKARRAMQPPFAFPQWQGEPLAGKSLVVVLEQGAGDNIQFVRYAPLLKARGVTRLTFVQPSALVSLLSTAHGVDAMISDISSMPPHDYWAFPLSLPFHLGTTLDTIPDTLPYLWALPERIERWRPRLPAGGFRVGLVWKGNPDHKNDANRSLSHLSLLAPLWTVPDVSFVSLQKGQGEDEARQPPPDQPLVHLGDDIADFADTAAIIAQLDLVITVDSAAAHVAGALGKPVWVLLPGVGTDWRWLLDREDSPWYPRAMRLFRQPATAVSWEDTIAGITDALRDWVQTAPASTLPVLDHALATVVTVGTAAATPTVADDNLLEQAREAFLAGRRNEAESWLREALRRDPGNSAAWNNLGSVLSESGRDADAEAAYREAISLDPGLADPHINLAYLLNRGGRIDDAEGAFRQAVTLRPDDTDLRNSFGILLLNAGLADRAEDAFREAIGLDARAPSSWNNLGNALRVQQRFVEAEAAYREALSLLPEDNLLLNNLAVVLSESGRAEEAISLLRRITTLAPYYADGWNNLGTILQKEQRLTEAEAAYRKAIALHPGFAAAHGNLANLLDGQLHLVEAESEYRRAAALDPNFIPTHWNLALLLLNQGRWTEAWPWFDRRNDPFRPMRNRQFGCPEWRGEDLAGKSLLIDTIEGQGDNIMCARYIPLLKQAGARKVTLIHRHSLKPLLDTVSGVDVVIAEPDPQARYDFWTFSFSLPIRFGTTPETIPATIPYAFPLESRLAYWRRRLAPVEGFRVGLVWKGDPVNDVDRQRSLSHLSILAPLWAVPGVSFVSLQKGQGEDEARQPPPGQPLVHLGGDIADFADTAAIVTELDLLITVDTAAAHVAGAVGRPAWVLLAGIGKDWRWLSERRDTPWYPGVMRLFRQQRSATDWDAVVHELADALRARVAGEPEPAPPPTAAVLPPPAETSLRPPATEPSLEPSMTRPSLRPAAFVLASSDHGTLIVNRNDYADKGGGNLIGVGCQVLFNSSFDRDEVDLALRMLDFRRRLFGDGVMALDCGANIGVHTVEWAKQMHGWGSVIAVEAQERVFYALCGNITINNCFNARAIWGAVGAESGEILVPKPDYLQPGSYGSMEIRPSARNEFIGQPIDYSEQSGIRTRLFTIDSLDLPRVDFIKIDIEGMEIEALAGAMNTIRKFRPQMIIEKIKSDEAALRALLVAEGYRLAPFTGNLVAIHGSDPSHEQLLA